MYYGMNSDTNMHRYETPLDALLCFAVIVQIFRVHLLLAAPRGSRSRLSACWKIFSFVKEISAPLVVQSSCNGRSGREVVIWDNNRCPLVRRTASDTLVSRAHLAEAGDVSLRSVPAVS
jgi:hypothetical protein